GLWCVPCADSLDDLYKLAAKFGCTAEDLTEGIEFSHRLTHRQLYILPFVAQINTGQDAASCAITGEWVSANNLNAYGIPKPLYDYLNVKQSSLF
ncbi:hypothetical protein SASC598O11_000340, partial [Snodgrassella alvi SCGC AB-598-O11]